MLVFGLITFAIGALLANVASVRVFALVALALVATGLVRDVYVGWPVGQAALVAIGALVCSQLGYVVGICFMALAEAKPGRFDEMESPGAAKKTELDKSSAAPLNGED